MTTPAALDLGRESYDPAPLHGHRLTRVVVGGLCARLAAPSPAERASLACLEPGRADLIVPGSAVCLEALARLAFDALMGSDRSPREGMLYEILTEG